MKRNIINYFRDNIKEYFIIVLIFVIGIFIGIIFINNVNDVQKDEIKNYVSSVVEFVKDNNNIDDNNILWETIRNNVLTVILFGFLGSTVIGIPILYLLIGYKGFSLSYTISSIVATIGVPKGIMFIATALFLQNIIYICALFIISASGMKLYKAILDYRRRESIKPEILKHLVYLVISILFMIVAALVEVYVSTNLVFFFKKYI